MCLYHKISMLEIEKGKPPAAIRSVKKDRFLDTLLDSNASMCTIYCLSSEHTQSSSKWREKWRRSSRKRSLISLLCGVNCPAVEIKGSFVSCPTFRRHYSSPHLYLRNLFVGRCQGSIRDNAEAGTHRSGLGAIGLIWGPPLCSLPLLIHHGPDSWTDCRPPSTKRGRLTTPGPLPGWGGGRGGLPARTAAAPR